MAVHEVFAYLCVDGATDAIAFYEKAFGATEKMKLVEPGGRIGHAELDFDGTTVMLADEFPEIGVRSPASLGGSPVTLHLHVDDTDAVVNSAARAGATVEMPPTDMFYGERTAVVRDPFGHRWNIGHSIEEVSPDEMQRRYDELAEGS
ncbi:MAG: VOC family protein [Gammaproteobacteria bacterium]|nr:VOC family protein [Gammaproteobacteria bacterium]MDE0227092.1 VOC family protein [Gammaproteobacteria bacterium]